MFNRLNFKSKCLLFCLNLFFFNYKIYSECNNYCCKEKNKKNLNDNIKNDDDLKNNKCNDNYNKDDEENNSENEENDKYYLNSGYDIDLPLNILWANCNCSYLGLFRFFLSDNYFLDKLINEKTSIFTEDQKKKKTIIEVIKKIQNNSETINKTSELFKKILSSKANYNKEITEILDIIAGEHNCEVSTQFFRLIRFYFFETFYLAIFNKGNSTYQYITNQCPENLDDINNTNKYYLIYNSSKDKIKINEFIEKKQSDNTKKKYELIGIIGICGNLENTTLGGTDFVSILPVFNKKKVKKGYVIYQFNDRSDIMTVDELNKLERFGNWENPRFHLLIYKNV